MYLICFNGQPKILVMTDAHTELPAKHFDASLPAAFNGMEPKSNIKQSFAQGYLCTNAQPWIQQAHVSAGHKS